jgi:hypothetical protein
MQLFSADPKIFSKYFGIKFLSIKTLKKWPQKLLIIGTNPFISKPSPNHNPQPRIDFSYRDQTSVLLSVESSCSAPERKPNRQDLSFAIVKMISKLS